MAIKTPEAREILKALVIEGKLSNQEIADELSGQCNVADVSNSFRADRDNDGQAIVGPLDFLVYDEAKQ